MDIICLNCDQILKNPVERNNRHDNFCEEHTKNFDYCPSCNAPFYGSINKGLKKILDKYENERINKQIKMDEDIIQCTLCSFECTPWNFCYHVAEDHKKELIEKFGKKKIYQMEKIQPNLAPQEIKYEKYPSVNNIPDNIINQFENIQISNFKKLNSGEIYPNNNCFTERKKDEKKAEKPLSMSQVTNLYYCNKKHQAINCDCCIPDHICCEGNCLCVRCMNYNVKKFHLKNEELFNKAGRVAKPENGEYHCGKKFNLSIKNSVGMKFYSHKQCSYYSQYFCKECEILNKYKDIYLDYISNN